VSTNFCAAGKDGVREERVTTSSRARGALVLLLVFGNVVSLHRKRRAAAKTLFQGQGHTRVRRVKTKFLPRAHALFISLCLIAFSAGVSAAAAGIGLKLFAEGFTSPTTLLPLEDGSGRLLVADQVGVISVLTKEGAKAEQPFFDVRSRLTKLNEGFDERGLLGLALHPHFKENRKVYLTYSAPLRKEPPADWDNTLRLSEFKVMENNRASVDPASERVLIEIDKP